MIENLIENEKHTKQNVQNNCRETEILLSD